MSILLFGFFEFLLNIPFGVWRVRTRRFSFEWMLAIHSAVPIIVAARILTGMQFEWKIFPFYLLSYGLGQYVGGRIGDYVRKRKNLTNPD